MAVDPDLLDLLRQTVTFSPRTEVSLMGEYTYAEEPTTTQARVVHRTMRVISSDGEDARVSGYVVVPHVGITSTDSITLPDGSSPEIMRVDNIPDDVGEPHHQVVYFQ